ncbi:hypothetical protein OG471_39340 [Streptomyces sp. NBC_01336]|uniref:hypothetical protein n=1 Tax=Streptomyces sp. NBC_01336 TaxID=2903829 RepID=UPI002E0FCFFA|nr:hypothetical protein OG471_39340 [Streptomyces sp. NBC_01336]
MGLMSWLRGGRSTGGDPSPGDAHASRPDRVERVDVSRLAPVQRSVTGQDLVIDPGGFQAALTTRQDTALGTPLGHLVSPDAPAGLVHGVALAAPGSPAPALQRTVGMPLRPRTKPAPVAVQRAYGESAPALTTAAGASAEVGLPVRHLVGDEPLVQRSEAAGQTDAGPDTSQDSPGAAAVRRTASSTSPQPSRRTPGLGAPLPGLPPTAQRQAHRPSDVQPSASRPPVVQREPTSAASADDSSVSAGDAMPVAPEAHVPSDGTEAAVPVAPLLGDAPLAGAASGGEPGGEGVAAATPASTVPVQRSEAVRAGLPPVPPPAAGPTAPLLGDRPLSLRSATDPGPPAGAVVQRAPEDSGVQRLPAPPAGPPPSQPSAVPVRWTVPDPGAPSGPPAPLLQREAVPVQRHAVEAAPVQRRAVGAAPVQRHALGAPPVPASAAARTGGRTTTSPTTTSPTAGSVAVAAGVAQRMADGSVVFGAAPLHGTSRPVIQRDAEIAEEPPPLPEPEPPPVAEPEPGPEASAGPEAVPPAADSDARAGAAAGQGPPPPVTDELVRALYGPLSRLLKADLRLDRERAGFHINTRH